MICRDTWALHLTLDPNGPPAEPYNFVNPTSTTSYSLVEVRDNPSSEDDEDVDPELAQLLKENSDLSSSSDEAEEQEDPIDDAPQQPRRPRGRLSRYDKQYSNIAILVASLWMLRIPVMYRDFIKCVNPTPWNWINAA